ncbi:MAG: hypothetical protein FH759_06125 [Sediminimonas qiaohouensis]|uniref:DUF2946 domain-containing protein n=1 Tax=Sediminimonas qiaohouensis TaxID=552061 RepID=A0A7C9LAJ2_9RHOB|nr:DUF2946 family protein [Sediminimonas qiaohouensis]MTJ04257.1 hypothetical protein [Sediminimonas qiaohouensis]
MNDTSPHPIYALLLVLCLITVSVAEVMARTSMAVADEGSARLVICGAHGAEVIELPGVPRDHADCDLCPACHMATPTLQDDLPRVSAPDGIVRLRQIFRPVSQTTPRRVAMRLARAPPKAS